MITLDLQKSCVNKEYQIWQQLFNFYCSHGCPLDIMDNMLVDLSNCKKVLESSYVETVHFLWAINKREYQTTFVKTDAESMVFLEQHISWHDFVVHVTIKDNCVTFEVIKGSY
jgi:hypothetical protein